MKKFRLELIFNELNQRLIYILDQTERIKDELTINSRFHVLKKQAKKLDNDLIVYSTRIRAIYKELQKYGYINAFSTLETDKTIHTIMRNIDFLVYE